MRTLSFYYLCEGTSDEPMLAHIEILASRYSNCGVMGIARSGSQSVGDKIAMLMAEGATFDFLVIHRDADSRDHSAREVEIADALAAFGAKGCAMIPMQAIEAWVLVDENEIRLSAGCPSGRQPLGIPSRRAIENTADPKSLLKNALVQANGSTGRRHKKAVQKFSSWRRTLIQRLDIDGPVRELTSWRRFESDLEQLMGRII